MSEAYSELFNLYSEADLLHQFAEWALTCARNGDKEEALAALMRAKTRFGDLWAMRQRLDDSIRELGGTP